jgi:hypothetical protein
MVSIKEVFNNLNMGGSDYRRRECESQLLGGLEFGTWLLFSPIVEMMIQSDFHIFQGGGSTTIKRIVFFL